MIIKGKARSGPGALAAHLGNAEKNERVQLLETRGTVASDLRGALIEMDAYAAGTQCERSLYHAAISPEPPHRLTPEQRMEAVDALEKKLGLDGHSRVVVVHEKLGREHVHVVWSRIDLDQMRAVPDSHNYRKHEECSRDLERLFGHERVQGAHAERDGIVRPDRTPSRSELRQEERTGMKGRDVKAEVSEAFRTSDGPAAFKSALEERGYWLAKGDRRDFVIIDCKGGIHSLARRIDSMKAADLRDFMAPLDRESLPTIQEAQSVARDFRQTEREAWNEGDLEKRFSRGGDYVSQTTAAQKEHKRIQAKLDREADRDPTWDRVENGEEQREREVQERQAREQSEPAHDGASGSPEPDLGVELTDAQRERLDRLLGSSDGPSRGGSGPQRGAPDGGRTRSR